MTTRLVLAFSITTSTAFWAMQWFRPYPGAVVLKWLPIGALILYAYLNRRVKGGGMLTAALFFHSIGDVLLEVDRKGLFLPAVGAFMVGHLLFAACFWQSRRVLSAVPLNRKLSSVLIVGAAATMSVILLPKLGGVLQVAVPIYIAAIVTMSILAQTAGYGGWFVAVGALSYMFSDSVIAWNTFVQPLPWELYVTWPTYYGAQLLITLGVTRGQPDRAAV